MRYMALLLLIGCGPYVYIPPGAEDPALCEPACEVLERYKVEGWDGSPGPDEVFGTADDVPCAQVCRETIRAGYPFQVKCLSGAGSRGEAEGCYGD
jgi:hypothetical protein